MSANFTAAQLAEFKTFEMRPVGFTVLEGLAIAATATGAGFMFWYFPSDSWIWFSPKLTFALVAVVVVCVGAAVKTVYERIIGVTPPR